MSASKFDIIVIGAGSGGLSIGLFMAKAGFKVLMAAISDHDIGGDCLNDGCVPSKAFIHVSRMAHNARLAARFGLQVDGKIDLKKATDYVYERQEVIRAHENAKWLQEQGVETALGYAHFTAANEIEIEEKRYEAKKIVIATGSKPRKLTIAGVDHVEKYFDNENIFEQEVLPKRLLVIGGGPIGIEIAQAMSRLGSEITVIQKAKNLLPHDDVAVSGILRTQLEKEGLKIFTSASVDRFTSANEAQITMGDGTQATQEFDAVFAGVGRQLSLESLHLEHADIKVKEGKIIRDKYLRTTNKNVFVCGDIAGDLMFSHAAEFHARIILNNLFSPFKKALNNDHLSWVTFTDPEVASFGLSEKQLKERGTIYERLEEDFTDDDRAVVDGYQYGKMILFISPNSLLGKQKILGGTMIAPNAGELIQELILANSQGLSINAIFNKIYPYPVASRINQKIMLTYKSKGLTGGIKKLLQIAYKIFS